MRVNVYRWDGCNHITVLKLLALGHSAAVLVHAFIGELEAFNSLQLN